MAQRRTKMLTGILSLALLGNPVLAAGVIAAETKPAGAMSYQEVGDLYMRSFGVMSGQEEVAQPQNAKKVDLTIASLSRQEKLQYLYALLADNENNQNGNPSTTLMDQAIRPLIKDIDALYGQGQDYSQHLMNRINNTRTVFGEVALTQMLCHPLSDRTSLQARQNLVKKLVTDDVFFAKVEALVARMTPEAESALFSFCRTENKPTKEQIDRLFFGKALNGLNSNAVALEAITRLQDLGSAAIMGVPLLIPALFLYAGYKNGQHANDNPYAMEVQILPNMRSSLRWIKAYYDPRTYINEPRLVPREGQDPEIEIGCNWGLKGGSIAYAIIHGLQLFVAKKGFDRGKQMHDTMNYLQARLMGAATLVTAIADMKVLAAQEPVLAQGIMGRQTMDTLFDGSSAHYSQDFKDLIALLQTNTFKGNPSFFSLAGRVLSAHTLMSRTKGELFGALELFGEMDACLSAAKLYKKFAGQRVHYCFVDFVERDKPYIAMKEFWNPIVDPRVVVTNDIELGAPGKARTMIVTGANTGGKSTILKGMMINLLFAQAFGIAPANSFTMTPFVYLGSSLNINDDTAAGYSLYQAEVNRAKMLMQAARALNGNQFGFLVIDELFRGTSPEQAEKGTYDCAKEFLTYDNAMVVLATHFSKLTTALEKESNGLCKNYKIEVRKDAHGNLIRPFKLEEGVNSTHIAGDILQGALKQN